MPTVLERVIAEQRAASRSIPIREYWLDIGRLEDFEQAHAEFHRSSCDLDKSRRDWPRLDRNKACADPARASVFEVATVSRRDGGDYGSIAQAVADGASGLRGGDRHRDRAPCGQICKSSPRPASRHGPGREAAVRITGAATEISVRPCQRRIQSALPPGDDGTCRELREARGDHGRRLCRPGHQGLAARPRSSCDRIRHGRRRRRRAGGISATNWTISCGCSGRGIASQRWARLRRARHRRRRPSRPAARYAAGAIRPRPHGLSRSPGHPPHSRQCRRRHHRGPISSAAASRSTARRRTSPASATRAIATCMSRPCVARGPACSLPEALGVVHLIDASERALRTKTWISPWSGLHDLRGAARRGSSEK